MSRELMIYENPVLTTEVNPGQVLEALPGSRATLKSLHTPGGVEYHPNWDSPTNIFGYVRGVTEREERPGSYVAGSTLVKMVLNEYADPPIFGNSSLLLDYFAQDEKNVYLAVGEIHAIDRKTASAEPRRRGRPKQLEETKSDKDARLLGEDSITLTPEELEQLKMDLQKLVTFRREGPPKDYVFETLDGTQYKLPEILLSLKEI